MWYNVGMRNKKQTSITLSLEALQLLSEAAKQLGLSKTGILEMFIRESTKQRGIVVTLPMVIQPLERKIVTEDQFAVTSTHRGKGISFQE